MKNFIIGILIGGVLGVIGGFASVYGVLKVLEERGQVRRGYFVDGLGAAQFALPGAVDRLRAARESPDDALGAESLVEPIALASTDVAQPFGAALSWPATDGRPTRSVSSLVVLRDGNALAWFDRRGHHLVTFPATTVILTQVCANACGEHAVGSRSITTKSATLPASTEPRRSPIPSRAAASVV